MKTSSPIEYKDFLGGVNQEVPASDIMDNEVSMAVNFKPRPPRIRSRGGLRKLFQYIAPNGGAETVYGLKVARRSGIRGMVVLGQSHTSWYDMTVNYGLNVALGTLGPSGAAEAWSVAAWNDSILAARPSDGLRLVQLADPSLGLVDRVGAAGIFAPPGTLAAADGGAGVLTAANYSYVYAYKDSRLGSIGPYGGLSNTLALGASKQVNVTGFSAPTNPRWDTTVLYRTLPNGTGQWLKIAEFASSTVSYVDNIPITQQGELASSTNTAPVAGTSSVVVWNGRTWITDGRLLYPSNILNPEAFPAAQALEVGPDDNEEIVELYATRYRLIVGKRRSMWSVTGTGATSWDVKAFDTVRGMIARRAITEVGGLVMWASDDDYFVSDGVSPGTPMSGAGRRKLRPFFEEREAADDLIALPIPSSDGVLFGMGSSVVTRELS